MGDNTQTEIELDPLNHTLSAGDKLRMSKDGISAPLKFLYSYANAEYIVAEELPTGNIIEFETPRFIEMLNDLETLNHERK